jgi:hypothetical protein
MTSHRNRSQGAQMARVWSFLDLSYPPYLSYLPYPSYLSYPSYPPHPPHTFSSNIPIAAPSPAIA